MSNDTTITAYNVKTKEKNVPMKDAQFVAEAKKPDYIYIHLTSSSPGFNFPKFLSQVTEKLPKQKIVISGYPAVGYK